MRVLGSLPGEVSAAVRTTIAATGVSTHPAAGNVLPSLATAHFNFRYLPGAPVLCLRQLKYDKIRLCSPWNRQSAQNRVSQNDVGIEIFRLCL